MPKKPLLLSSAKMPVLIPSRFSLSRFQWILLCAWLFFVVIGFLNLVTSLQHILRGRPSQLQSVSPSDMAVGPVFATTEFSLPATSSNEVLHYIIPVRLTVPSIGVNSSVEHVGILTDGSMQTPSSFSTVGWYKDGSKPGQAGNAVFDGHVNNALTSAGVFEHLDQIRLGDTILVQDGKGTVLTFVVESEQLYLVGQAPTALVFAQTGPPRLVLITCDGAWDQGKKMFDERLVIYAHLVKGS